MYEESREQFEECLDKLVDKNVNKNLIYETYNDLAHVYEKVKNYDKMI